MEKNLYIDASHPDETRVVLKSGNHIEEYEYENKNKLYLVEEKNYSFLLCSFLLAKMKQKDIKYLIEF